MNDLRSYSIVTYLKQKLGGRPHFRGSANYWEERYAEGGNSGLGSYHELAHFKAAVLNKLVAEHQMASVIEFGCGDGNQLSVAAYPRYLGLDVSKTAIQHCMKQYAADCTKSFFLYDSMAFVDHQSLFRADLSLSIDVLYHLVEDAVYQRYLDHLFQAGRRMVVIYSMNTPQLNRKTMPHVKLRHITHDIEQQFPQWTLVDTIANKYPRSEFGKQGSDANFYMYEPKH